jgi:NAD(P)H dehydrogenase (quinone)
MIAVTGATGQLGHFVIDALLKRIPAKEIVVAVRNTAKAADLAAKGVTVRHADYNDTLSLTTAFAGIDTLLLISSNEVGKRLAQHVNVINVAKTAGVGRIVYTSILHADASPLSLADEHRGTEDAIKRSGMAYTILRNGWYAENYTSAIPAALANGAFMGAAGNGRLSLAPRADYAEAAAVVLTSGEEGNHVYELAGDEACTLAELAAEVSRQTGRDIPYRNMTEAEYAAALAKTGLPGWLAAAFASWDANAAKGALFDSSRQLGRLIGRPTTPLGDMVARALKK